jgi:formylglycine-generating enzyme required for sulfatase activity
MLRPTPGVTMEFVYIRPGAFAMGGRSDPQHDYQGVEKPRHTVTITRGFHIGKHEVTRGQFAAFVDATGYETGARREGSAWACQPDGTWKSTRGVDWRNPKSFRQDDTHPVVAVSWNDAKAFCDWVARKTGREVRLPTEAEWEYACRAGTTGSWACGDASLLGKSAWYYLNSGMRTHPVGQKEPNAWGVYDVHGNVWEWVADRYDPTYYASSPVKDPAGPAKGTDRVLRGGSWSDSSYKCRSAYRYRCHPAYCGTLWGFRAAVSSTEDARRTGAVHR